jgi:hypothetical protein
MTRAPRLSARMRALHEATEIAEERALRLDAAAWVRIVASRIEGEGYQP